MLSVLPNKVVVQLNGFIVLGIDSSICGESE